MARRRRQALQRDARSGGPCRAPTLADLAGGDPLSNADAIRQLLAGKTGPYRDIVLLNAAAGLLVGEKVETLREGVELRRQGAGRRRRATGAGASCPGDQPALMDMPPLTDILEQIAAYKRADVAALRRAESQDAVEARDRCGVRAARLHRRAAAGRRAGAAWR